MRLIERKECPMRNPDNGNCLSAGGFCTAVNDTICEALHNAFKHGEQSKIEWATLALATQSEMYAKKNLEILRKIHEKVTSPTIDPESLRPTGEWTGEADGYADGELVYDVWYCSECNNCIDDGTDDPDMLPNFCPNCGAKMKGAAHG